MRRLLNKLFSVNLKWKFHPAEIKISDEVLHNPARGWYTIYPFFLEKEPDFDELYWCLGKEETIALVIINIGAYREQRLDAAAINRMRQILGFFEKHSYDVILRVTYDHEGNAVEREPFFFKVVLEHLEQLIPVVREFSKTVFIWQGMLIGNWGEMHTSRFLFPSKLRQLWGVMSTGLEDDVYLAVRRPSMWRILHPEACGKAQLPADTTGLFDDAMFGSDSHMGTFGQDGKESTGWENLWSREDELAFEDELCKQVPNGGEAVCGEEYAEMFTPQSTLDVLKKMHVTYLNQAHDEKILKLWKQWEWQGESLYDYIGKYLGYRFCIRKADVVPDKKENGIRVTVAIENVGFANCYQPVDVLLLQTDSYGNQELVKFDTDIRTLDSGSVQEISCMLEKADGELYLRMLRKADSRVIYFANQSEPDGSVFLGGFTEF